MEPVLSGFRVLDFGHYIPGPYVGMLLADQGAEAIKVESPQGDPYRRNPGFSVLNRNKRGIVLDLKKEICRDAAMQLAATADVIIENFSPAVAERLGIGFERINKINPRTVYLSISGYGRKGPYRSRPGWDAAVSAAAGMYVGQSGGEKFPPTYLVLPLASYYAALLGAYSVTMALYAREITGKGQRVDISLFAAVFAAGSAGIVDFKDRVILPPTYAPQGRSPVYRLYKGSDGKWFFLALGNMTFVTKFALAMGKDEWLLDDRFEGAPFMIVPPYSDEIASELQTIFSTKTREEWLQFLHSQDIPCAPAEPVTSYIDDPQIAANQMAVEVEDPILGKGRQMGIPVRLERNPGQIKRPAPLLGEHTGEVLGEISDMSPNDISQIRAMAGPDLHPDPARGT